MKEEKEPSFLSANWMIFKIQVPAIAQCVGIRVIDLLNVQYATLLQDP